MAPLWNPLLGRWMTRDLCELHTEPEEQPAAEDLERKRAEDLERAGVARKARMTLETFQAGTASQSKALEAIRSGRSVWLWGAPGVGKTHLAAGAVLEAIETSSARFAPVPDLAAELRASAVDPSGPGAVESAIECLRTVDLLVLDDLAVERPTPFVIEQLYRVADSRYDAERRTIVTSNVPPSKVAAAIGGRLHSRLVGLCDGAVVRVEGPDRRIGGGAR